MGNARLERARTGRGRTAAATAIAIAGALALGAAHAGAQEPACRDCDVEVQARQRVEQRALAQQLESLSRRLAALAERHEEDEAIHRALQRASEALKSPGLESGEVVRELAKAQKAIAARAHAVDHDPQVMRLLDQLAALETQAAFTAYAQSPRPSGWLGVTYQGDQEQKSRNGELFVYHHDYPAIISVTPSSPAAKAGVRPGDTLIAYNEHDVRKGGLSLTKLLRPGETVVLRLRRNGRERDVAVKVGQRETRVARVWTTPEPRSYPRVPAPPEVRVIPMPPEAAVAPMPPMPDPGSFYTTTSTSMVAGAELTPMNADLREVFGTERGLLVLRVAVGTPAAEAGLRGGDVIVGAAGEPITSTRVLSAQLRAASSSRDNSREVELDIIRKKKQKTIVLRW